MEVQIAKIEERLEKEADTVYRNIKSRCKTYGELKNEIYIRLKQEKWRGSDTGKVVLEKVAKKYEEDVLRIEMPPLKGSVD